MFDAAQVRRVQPIHAIAGDAENQPVGRDKIPWKAGSEPLRRCACQQAKVPVGFTDFRIVLTAAAALHDDRAIGHHHRA